jgi:hypothetical protein
MEQYKRHKSLQKGAREAVRPGILARYIARGVIIYYTLSISSLPIIRGPCRSLLLTHQCLRRGGQVSFQNNYRYPHYANHCDQRKVQICAVDGLLVLLRERSRGVCCALG